MATYTDPVTGKTRDANLGDEGRSTGTSWVGVLALLLAVALGAWYFYGRGPMTRDVTNTGASTLTQPVTTPSSPNASPTHPAPSPNPGP